MEVTESAPPRPAHYDIAVALADEGVPVRAIARAIRTPGETVYEVLKAAMGEGRLFELPRDDWPSAASSTKQNRSPAERTVLDFSEDQVHLSCCVCFKLTNLQSTVFTAVLRRSQCTKEQLHATIEAKRGADEPTDMKMVDVVICLIRRRLKAAGYTDVTIDTVWGAGYRMKQESRDRVFAILLAHLNNSAPAAAHGNSTP